MTGKPIFEPSFWAERLKRAEAIKQRHRALFECDEATWRRGEGWHRAFLAKYVKPTDSILDCGCGYGRLLYLLPESWRGEYKGIDLSPEFVQLAREEYPHDSFFCGDVRDLATAEPPSQKYDWAVMISFRSMIRREAGDEVWAECEREIRRCAKRLMYLEYREEEGVIE